MAVKHLFDFGAEGRVAFAIIEERQRQNEKFGDVDLPEGLEFTASDALLEDVYRQLQGKGETTLRMILIEEVFEVFNSTTDEAREVELIQVAAFCQRWVRQLRRKREARRG